LPKKTEQTRIMGQFSEEIQESSLQATQDYDCKLMIITAYTCWCYGFILLSTSMLILVIFY